MKASRFEDLEVWVLAKELALAIYRFSDDGRFARDFPLRDQIRKAAISVMSNIAEGFDRYSRAEFRNYLSNFSRFRVRGAVPALPRA